jgi:hypothetical protein
MSFEVKILKKFAYSDAPVTFAVAVIVDVVVAVVWNPLLIQGVTPPRIIHPDDFLGLIATLLEKLMSLKLMGLRVE